MDYDGDPEAEYDKLDEREHVLKRPDTYVGSIEQENKTVTLASLAADGTFEMEDKMIKYIPGLERIYLEILSNAADNGSKSTELGLDPGKLVVTVTDTYIEIYNEGRPVPTVWHKKHKTWIPSMIFFDMRSGSNFDDTKQRKWAGRNGLGAKLTAIFSKEYEVICHNVSDHMRHKQKAYHNLSVISEPERTEIPVGSTESSYTQVTFYPDFKMFYCDSDAKNVHIKGINLEPLTDDPNHCTLCWDRNKGDDYVGKFNPDMVEMFAALALDFSFNCGVKIDFIYDSSAQNIRREVFFDARSPLEYVKYYMPEMVNIKTEPIVFTSPDGSSRVVLLDTPHHGKQKSFANGMPTRQGGVHVNEWLNGICSNLKDSLKKKDITIDARHIRNHVTIFLSYYCDKPKFETQTKERLTSPKPKITITKKMLRIFETWKAVEAIMAAAAKKEKTKLANTTDGKKHRYVKVPNSEEAEFAATDKSHLCYGFLLEGLSAKPFFVDGLKHVKDARLYLGCIALRGKILNTRKSKTEKEANSKVINDIKTFFGLRENMDYSIERNLKTLRYGHCICLTDADVDGTHIKVLIINFLSKYKGLLESGFLLARLTPIITVTRLKERRKFYSLAEYAKWQLKTSDHQKWKPHYFKGLGSATPEMIKDAFSNPIDQHCECSSDDQDILELIMGEQHADTRKKLYRMLVKLKPDQRMDSTRIQKIEDIIYEEFILFAIQGNRRAIPSIVDGLKDSYRKIVYAARKRKYEFEGVEEFQGIVKNLTKYRHGPDSMKACIVGFAMAFPGSNNIPILEGEGNFGSRLGLGSDASAARYISCRPSSILKYLIRSEDDVLLKSEMEDGKEVGVEFYYPILPLMLLNRCKGVGWGWATDSPNYNPIQLIDWIKYYIQHIKDGKPVNFHTPTLIPWWRGYKGAVFRRKNGQLVTRGYFENRGSTCYIHDIPIVTSGQVYQKFLDGLVESGEIECYKPTSVDSNRPSYKLVGCKNGFKYHRQLELEKNIVESSCTFMERDDIPKIHIYGAPHVMMKWCDIRYEQYVLRKKHYVDKLKEDVRLNNLRMMFVEDIISEPARFDIRNRSDEYTTGYMISKGYPMIFMKMQLNTLSREKVKKLRNEVENLNLEIERYENTHPGDLWMKELDELTRELEKKYPGQWDFYPGYGTKTMEIPY